MSNEQYIYGGFALIICAVFSAFGIIAIITMCRSRSNYKKKKTMNEEIITERERIKREAIAAFKELFPEYNLDDLHGTFFVKGYREAAKQLQSRIASLEGEQKWISVTTKPDVEKTYLWCKVPICEPPYVGAMINEDFTPDYYTHYMELGNDFFPSPPLSQKDSKTDV